jgi:predicted metal-dependent peptidase
MTVAGKLPQHVVEALDALAKQAPKQWHKELKAFYRNTVEGIESTRTWSRPNRRYGLFEAGTKSGLGKKLVIGVDTSGSMSTEDIRHILAECHAMLKCGVEARVMFFDTQVHSTIRLTRGASIGECGRGGTDFKDFFTHANKCNPDGIVVFTDGDDGASIKDATKSQVLWVLIAGDRKHGTVCNFGKKVLLDK